MFSFRQFYTCTTTTAAAAAVAGAGLREKPSCRRESITDNLHEPDRMMMVKQLHCPLLHESRLSHTTIIVDLASNGSPAEGWPSSDRLCIHWG